MALISVRADHVNPVGPPSLPSCLQWIDSLKITSTLKSLDRKGSASPGPCCSVQSLTESGRGWLEHNFHHLLSLGSPPRVTLGIKQGHIHSQYCLQHDSHKWECYRSVFLPLFLHIYVYVRACVHVHACAGVCACVWVRTSAYMYTHTRCVHNGASDTVSSRGSP